MSDITEKGLRNLSAFQLDCISMFFALSSVFLVGLGVFRNNPNVMLVSVCFSLLALRFRFRASSKMKEE